MVPPLAKNSTAMSSFWKCSNGRLNPDTSMFDPSNDAGGGIRANFQDLRIRKRLLLSRSRNRNCMPVAVTVKFSYTSSLDSCVALDCLSNTNDTTTTG